MDFTLSKEHEMLRKMYREFAQNEVKSLAQEIDEEERFPGETIPKLAKLGLLGIPFPKKYGADTELTIAKCSYQELRDKGIPVIDLKQKENARCTVDMLTAALLELMLDKDAAVAELNAIGIVVYKQIQTKGLTRISRVSPFCLSLGDFLPLRYDVTVILHVFSCRPQRRSE